MTKEKDHLKTLHVIWFHLYNIFVVYDKIIEMKWQDVNGKIIEMKYRFVFFEN